MRGFIFYRGLSPIDNQRIVGIAVLRSGNRKTGDMVQTYILRADMHPLDAIKLREDVSICGHCVHRGSKLLNRERTCYVNVGQSVSSVYRAFLRGSYPDMTHDLDHAASILHGRKVRLGAYGDPAMIPHTVWYALLSQCDGWTGYTHQWRFPWAVAMRELVMASVESVSEHDTARSLGWRTFRVHKDDDLQRHEFTCPASDEAGKKTTCSSCLACDGALKSSAASVAIRVHGVMARHFN